MPWDFALILLLLSVAVPIQGYLRMQKLLAVPQVSSLQRLSLYASTIALQWAAAGVVGWRAWAHGMRAAQFGLRLPDKPRLLIVGVAGGAFLFALQSLNLRRLSRIPEQSRGRLQQIAVRIFPQSTIESLVFVAVVITAAVCEEFLYRGFALEALRFLRWPSFAAALGSSVFFGLAHIYQGRSGVATTFILGTVFALAKMTYGSLVPVMIWHGSLDLAAGLVGPVFLLRGKKLIFP
jgi:uncharacterized protein